MRLSESYKKDKEVIWKVEIEYNKERRILNDISR